MSQPAAATLPLGERPLRGRRESASAARFGRSAAAPEGARIRTADVVDWLAGRARANRFRVERVPFAALDGWSFDEGTGNLGHRSGRFFTIEGLSVRGAPGPFEDWQQPIINQPEIGILGMLVKEFDGVLHFLMQAKMEPGNSNLLQLSPTVQATRSNYTGVHRGAPVRYLDFFTGRDDSRVLSDSLQSEHGSWFYRKRNRNMIVEALGDVPDHDDHLWLTLGQIARLLHHDNLVNMDSRTVLSCVPFLDTGEDALHPDAEVLDWLTAERSRHDVVARRIPLAGTDGWRRGTHTVSRDDGRFFSIVAVGVEAGNREVSGWTQPLLEPHGLGVTAFLTQRLAGVLHVLAHARVEAGFCDVVEVGPTVQYTPGNYALLPAGTRPPYLDEVLTAAPGRIRYEAVHSEEGGRFLNAESRYLLVDADPLRAGEEPPPGYQWITTGQLAALTRHGQVNVQARTLLSLLYAAEATDGVRAAAR
ncbi:NDP-hexose 2,3-dehydratase family protein [Streptomyces violaceoruber]|uniref:NDP-hexose 2,3-dehydratase family protein n=1 Tax=Streptomyces violaceoruber TaxID=1935 RepID=UPI003B4306C2